MHDEPLKFFEFLQKYHAPLFKKKKVLEYGSADVNGSVRPYFKECDYTGLDWRADTGVDVVSLMHEYQGIPESYDVVITSSAVEHDPYWKESIENCLKLLKPGGSLILTCAGPAYEKHHEMCAPFRPGLPNEFYYKGISSQEIKVLIEGITSFKDIEDRSDNRDVMLLFFKKGGSNERQEKSKD